MIVVDNGQTSGPALRDLLPSDVVVLSTGANVGYTGAAKIAVDHWLTTDSTPTCVIGSHDLHVDPDCLATLVAAVAEEQGAGETRLALVAPAIVKSPVCWGGEWTGSRSRRLPALQGRRRRPKDRARRAHVGRRSAATRRDGRVIASVMMIERSFALANEPLFDTRLGSYHELRRERRSAQGGHVRSNRRSK